MENNSKKPKASVAILCIVFLIAIMAITVLIVDGPVHIAIVISFAFTVIMLMTQGFTWKDINKYIEYGGTLAVGPALILAVIGMLVGSWIASGTVPMIIYYGLKIISPNLFLVTSCVVSAITALATGSSWSTGATIGVALMGVGYGLGVNPAMTAGAIISGAFFGDKMSPLSDTTILAPAMAEGDLFDHIKSMFYTTIPALVISLVLYFILGMKHGSANASSEVIDTILVGIENTFKLNPLLLIPPILVIVLAFFKVPSLPTLIIATTTAFILSMVFQGQSVNALFNIMMDGFVSNTGVEAIDRLLSRGGIMSMMNTFSLTVIAIAYGGVLEKSRTLEVILDKMKSIIKSDGSLIVTTILTVIGVNFVTASQYLSIVLGGRMFVGEYKKRDFLPQVLSRTLEDSGTVTSPLIPWNLCGAFFIATLGIDPWVYVPFAFFNLLCPVISMIYGITGKFLWKTGDIPSAKTYRPLTEEETERLKLKKA